MVSDYDYADYTRNESSESESEATFSDSEFVQLSEYAILSGVLADRLMGFLSDFMLVFSNDWEFTKLNIGNIKESASFVFPDEEDEGNNWGNRGALLSSFRKLCELVGYDLTDDCSGEPYRWRTAPSKPIAMHLVPDGAALWRIDGQEANGSNGGPITIHAFTVDDMTPPNVHEALAAVRPQSNFYLIEKIEFIGNWRLFDSPRWDSTTEEVDEDCVCSQIGINVPPGTLAAMATDMASEGDESKYQQSKNLELYEAKRRIENLESMLNGNAEPALKPQPLEIAPPIDFRNSDAGEFHRLANALCNRLPNRQLQRMIRIMANWNRNEGGRR